MRFREHRGGLAESVATTVTLADRAALVTHAATLLRPWGVEVANDGLTTSPAGGDDKRIGWADVHIVSVEGYGVIGLIEGPADK